MINSTRLGLTLGTLFGALHTLWSLLVLIGWAQPLVDFSMWAHMAHMSVVVGPFDIVSALTVIVIASCIGYAVGKIAGTIWNKLHK